MVYEEVVVTIARTSLLCLGRLCCLTIGDSRCRHNTANSVHRVSERRKYGAATRAPAEPFVRERDGTRLIARLLRSDHEDHLLVLDEQRTTISPSDFRPLGGVNK